MVEALIKNPFMPGLFPLKLRVHRGAMDWATKKLYIMYELLTPQEMIIFSKQTNLDFPEDFPWDSPMDFFIPAFGYEAV